MQFSVPSPQVNLKSNSVLIIRDLEGTATAYASGLLGTEEKKRKRAGMDGAKANQMGLVDMRNNLVFVS